jgi:hypothetical protein
MIDKDMENEGAEVTTQETSEEPVKTNIKKLTPKERQKLVEDIEKQNIKEHLEEEKQRIKDLECPNCGCNLGLKPKDYLKQDNLPVPVECKKCEKVITVIINYREDPTTTNADITLKIRPYAWISQPPTMWTDKHVKRWAEEEMQAIKENRSTLKMNEQKLFRMQYLGLKKQKIVK